MKYIFIDIYFDKDIEWLTKHEGIERPLTQEELAIFRQPYYNNYREEMDSFPLDKPITEYQRKVLDDWMNISGEQGVEALGFRPFFYYSREDKE